MGCGASKRVAPRLPPEDPPPASVPQQGSPKKRHSSVPDRQKLHIKTVLTMVEVGLHADEAEALVEAMSLAEMVHTEARMNIRRHFHAAHDVLMSTKPASLAKHEAEALVNVLDDAELERTVLQAGMSMRDVLGNEAAIKHRAAIALQHPNRVLTAEQAQNDPEAELRAREAALEQLKHAVLHESSLKGCPFDSDTATDEDAPADAPAAAAVMDGSDAGSTDTVALTAEDGEILNYYIEQEESIKKRLSKVQMDDGADAAAAADDWQDQLMGLFNVDRHRVFKMPLLSVGVMAEHLKHAIGKPTTTASTTTTAEGGPPGAMTKKASAWALWDEQPAAAIVVVEHDTASQSASQSADPAEAAAARKSRASAAEIAEGWDEAAYNEFWQSLSHRAQLVLTDLYSLGVLSKQDDVAKQARFVKAIGTAYDPEAPTKSKATEHVHKTGHANNMSAHQAREARRQRNKAKGLHGSLNFTGSKRP